MEVKMNYKKTLAVASLTCFSVLSVAQDSRPFVAVDAAFKKGRLRWSEASEPFQSERARLGERFEPELWKYLGDDIDKQDKVSNFLLYPESLVSG